MASRPAPRTGPRGVDTHLDLHLGCGPGSPRAALDPRGSRLDPGRCRPGELGRTPGAGGPIGVEATGTYRAGRLARADGLHVVQVNRPTGACGGDTARRIRSTLRPRPGRPRPGWPPPAQDPGGSGRADPGAGVARRGPARPGWQPPSRDPGCCPALPRSWADHGSGARPGLVATWAAPRPGPLTRATAATKVALGILAAAGTGSRPSSPSSRNRSPRPPRHRWPWPGSGSTPPGSCWSPPAAPPGLDGLPPPTSA